MNKTSTDEGVIYCEWFALCNHPAAGLVAHPAFPGGVPTCARCADRFDMTFTSTYASTPEAPSKADPGTPTREEES